MKKTLIVLLFLAMAAGTASAQIGFSKGLIGGLNLATVGGDNAPGGASSVSNYAAGIFLELNVPGPFSFEANALYSIKGTKWNVGSVTYTDTYGYLDIPILAKYHLPIPMLSSSIYAGPMYSTLLSAKTKQEGGLLPGERDVKSNMTASDFGIVAGVGIGLANIRIDARYDMGLTTLDKAGNFKMYNRVVGIYVGIGI
ncbi:MAG TPA: porin family protein [Bacteroidota bacterium]|nr:porin family protein [Bacteroidota bacterium]